MYIRSPETCEITLIPLSGTVWPPQSKSVVTSCSQYAFCCMAFRLAGFVAPSPTVATRSVDNARSVFRGLSLKGRTFRNFDVAARPVRQNVRMVAADVAPKKGKGSGGRSKNSKGGGSGKREKKSSASPGLLKALEKYEAVIGIEVHVQLSTRTKAYCACSTKTVRIPNINVCPVCMGLPGSLPVVNRRVVELAAKAGMALDCEIAPYSRYDRKNYYYPDTPKNYQITQDEFPIATNGALHLPSSGKRIGITRLHMEEDSAKMSHEGGGAAGRLTDSTHSLIDFNRAGVPLIEIVSEPDMRSGAEAAEYGQELQRILRYVGTSDCNMQDGSLRCDVNVSIREKGSTEFGVKVELKNLNSFSAAQKSVDFEIERQAGVLDSGGSLRMETRTWDEKSGETKTMRVKEGAADYRYFPEPDLPPLRLAAETLDEWRKTLPELPSGKRERYQSEFVLSAYDARVLTDDIGTARYFEKTVAAGGDAKQAANWIMGDITKVLKSEKMEIKLCKLTAERLAEMIQMIEADVISNKVGKDLMTDLVLQGGSPAQIVEERDLKMISDPMVIRSIAQEVIDANGKELALYKEGKNRLFGFFVGKTLAATNGRGNPTMVNDILRELLDGSEEK